MSICSIPIKEFISLFIADLKVLDNAYVNYSKRYVLYNAIVYTENNLHELWIP